MGKIYINCSRCGKDLECEELCDVYTSKIDDSFICKDCYKKEKPDYIQQLKQQLVEKDEEIKKLNWQLKDKDFIIKNLNHSLSVAPNANAGQRARIDELTKIVEEKNKEIERLKNLFELNNEVVINQGKEMFDLRVQVLQQKQNQIQLAIQELEKVKILIQNAINFVRPNFVEVYDAINNQIKALKGNNDEPRQSN